MSKGYSGLFKNTKGYPVPGSIVLMASTEAFLKNIKKSNDLDTNGRLDIIGHGSATSIEYYSNGKNYIIDHRILSKLIRKNKKIKSIRLMSCNTGSYKNGFAQNLANKLNIVVEAPNNILWAYPNGNYIVASRNPTNPNYPNFNDLGKFIKFYPGGNKK